MRKLGTHSSFCSVNKCWFFCSIYSQLIGEMFVRLQSWHGSEAAAPNYRKMFNCSETFILSPDLHEQWKTSSGFDIFSRIIWKLFRIIMLVQVSERPSYRKCTEKPKLSHNNISPEHLKNLGLVLKCDKTTKKHKWLHTVHLIWVHAAQTLDSLSVFHDVALFSRCSVYLLYCCYVGKDPFQ